jgi:hypothetical protein
MYLGTAYELSELALPKEDALSTSLLTEPTPVLVAQPSRRLDQVAQAARQRGASEQTTTQLVSWVLVQSSSRAGRRSRGRGTERVRRRSP